LDDALRAYFLLALERLRARHRFMVFGYVLMPEHVHLLVSEPRQIALSKVVGSLKTAVSRRSSQQHAALWQRRYYDFNVLTHAKFVEKLQYMHRNPVRRGLVEKPEQYRWSSFNHWLTGQVGEVEIESHWTWNKREHAATKTHP
jgi:putative transposase